MGVSSSVAGTESEAAIDEEIKQSVVLIGGEAAAEFHGVPSMGP